MERELLNADELAQWIGVSRQRVYELCRSSPGFPVIVIGQRQYRFSRSAVQRWLDQGGALKKNIVTGESLEG